MKLSKVWQGPGAFACVLFALSGNQARADLLPMLDESAMDKTMDPCTDFYQYACGDWMKRTELPSDRPRWTRSFSTINEENLNQLKTILEDYAKGDFSLPSANAKKMGNFYAACMDEETIEKSSPKALAARLALIDTLTKENLAQGLGQLVAHGIGGLFSFGSETDAKDATRVIAGVDQGGLGLPNRDYYFDEKKAKIREAYVAHIAKMFVLVGTEEATAKKNAETILAFETRLAEKALSPTERRDPEKLYHLVKVTQLAEWAPDFNWTAYFEAAGAPQFTQLNVAVPEFFRGLSALIASTSIDDMKTYYRWKVLRGSARQLGKDLASESFNFYGRTLSGAKEMPVRWKFCVESVSSVFDDGLGEAFVAKTFGKEGKVQTLAMLKTIQSAFRENLKSVGWMDEATRTNALAKLDAIENKIGYPDQFTDLSSVEIGKDSHLSNVLAVSNFWARKGLAKIGKPKDRTEWGMPPQMVNAQYDPSVNDISFPAGILQSPMYSKTAPLAANYGAIGMVIGHELTHGFDDEGRQYDAKGNLNGWWTPGIDQVFEGKAACLVDQYSAYTVADGVHINGKLTLGENIADLGGMKIAFAAYKAAVKAASEVGRESAESSEEASPLTSDQQFFVSYAQAWCSKQAPEYEVMMAATDPHSPAKFRVNGVVVNMPEFSQAFGCKTGAPMAPENRCQIW